MKHQFYIKRPEVISESKGKRGDSGEINEKEIK